MPAIDWYERRDELEEGQVFRDRQGNLVKLDRRVPGDGTKWYAADWYPPCPGHKGYERGHWSYEDSTLEPGDLVEQVADPKN